MRLSRRAAVASMLLLMAPYVAFGQFRFHPAGGAVSDFAGKLTPTTLQRLENSVVQFQRRSGIDLRVVTIPEADLRGGAVEEYSRGLANRWAVGRSSGSRGLLLLVAIGSQDRAGVYHGATRLEVSRTLERNISNQLAGEVTGRMRDSLKAGWFDEAVTIGVDQVKFLIDQGKPGTVQSSPGASAPKPAAPPSSMVGLAAEGFSIGTGMFSLVFILLFLAIPAMIIAAIVRGIARGTGYQAGSRWSRRTHRGRAGIGTSIGLSGSDWSDTGWSSNTTSMSPGTTDNDSSSSSASSDWSSSSPSSDWSSSSSSDAGSSGSSSDWSSSSSSDAGSSGSSGGDFGGGGSTSSW